MFAYRQTERPGLEGGETNARTRSLKIPTIQGYAIKRANLEAISELTTWHDWVLATVTHGSVYVQATTADYVAIPSI